MVERGIDIGLVQPKLEFLIDEIKATLAKTPPVRISTHTMDGKQEPSGVDVCRQIIQPHQFLNYRQSFCKTCPVVSKL